MKEQAVRSMWSGAVSCIVFAIPAYFYSGVFVDAFLMSLCMMIVAPPGILLSGWLFCKNSFNN